MLAVFLVVVVPGLGFEFGRDLLEHDGQDALFRFLVGTVAVPDGDEVGVEADGHGETAEIVACANSWVSDDGLKSVDWIRRGREVGRWGGSNVRG